MNNRQRDLLLIGIMLAGAAVIFFQPKQKYAVAQKIGIEKLVPTTVAQWTSVTYDTSDYMDQWDSINEILARTYTNTSTRKGIDFIVEYSSDIRHAFSFHFPENCYRSSGNGIVTLEPWEFLMPDGTRFKAKVIVIKAIPGGHEKQDTLIAYWLVFDNKHIHETVGVKLDQMVAGLLSGAKQGFLVRADVRVGFKYTPENIKEARERLQGFLSDFYYDLDKEKRLKLIGKI